MEALRRISCGRSSICCLLLFTAMQCFGQSGTSDDLPSTTPAFSTLTSGPEVINLGSLSMQWNFPIVSKQGRGLPLHLGLSYSAPFWRQTTQGWQPGNWGWSSPLNIVAGSLTSTLTKSDCTGSTATFHTPIFLFSRSAWSYTDSAGNTHKFPPTITSFNACTQAFSAAVDVAATDGSGYLLHVSGGSSVTGSGSVTGPDGTILTPNIGASGVGVAITDTNGNTISANPNSTPTQTVTDTLGMTVLTATGGAVLNPPRSPDTYTYTDSTGTAQTVTVNYTTYNVQANFGCNLQQFIDQNHFANNNEPLVSAIVYPDGSSVAFTYEPSPGVSGAITGRVQSVKLRTGGTISYTYTGSTAGVDCTNLNAILSMTRQTPDGTTTYSRQNLSGTLWETTVVDAQGNETNYFFQYLAVNSSPGANGQFYEVKRQIYQGSNPGQLLETVFTCYNGSVADCSNTAITLPISQRVQIVQLPNGLQSQTTLFFNSSGSVTEEDKYDYGQNAPGSLIKKTTIAYASLGNNILNRPASVTVSDGSNNQVAQTTFGYDETPVASTSSQTPQHAAVLGSRGNRTSVSRLLSTGNTTITTHKTYDDSGNVATSTDALGNTTQFSYADNFSDGVNRNSFAYLTQTTLPTTGSVAHVVSRQYEPNTGLTVKSTDQNGTTTTFGFDAINRPLQVVYADGGGTNYNYPDPNTLERKTKLVGNTVIDSFTSLDGLGRTKQTRLVDPNGDDFVDTGYDNLGRKASESNPHRSTSSSTDGTTQYAYDALGRNTQITRPDGGIVSIDYSAFPKVISTDETGRQRSSKTDGLGRLLEVDEPGDASSGSASQGTATINGNLLSTQVQTQTAAAASATVSISGSEIPHTVCINGHCTQQFNSGTVNLRVNGSCGGGATFAEGSTSTGMASQLAASLNSNCSSIISATASGAGVILTARTSGSGTNYSLTTSHSGTCVCFSISAPNAMSGGQDNAFATINDAGTVTVTVGGFSASPVSYSASTNSNPTLLASALAQALNVSGSPVTATASGSNIVLTAKSVGAAGDMAVSITSSSSQASHFPQGSFSGSATMSGGTDAFGPGIAHPHVTLYTYNALSNLTCIEQHGSSPQGTGCSAAPSNDASSPWRVRRFIYDSLSRLVSATNPESGTISYQYDNNGNMLQKTSPAANQTGAAQQVVSFCYDPLNRVTGKAYSAQTCQSGLLPAGAAAVSYTYDHGANGIGHLTALADQAGSGSYTFDVMGRIATEQRTLLGVTKSMSYGYNLDGSIASITYPSNATILYTPDSTGRLLNAVDSANNLNYVSGAAYEPGGALTGFVSGNSGSFAGITNSFSYNSRLQPVNVSAASPTTTVLSLNYDFHFGSGDNGDVWGITNNKDATRNQSFNYDLLNRLTSAQNAGTDCTVTLSGSGQSKFWGGSYSYDAWGNLISKGVSKCSGENLTVTADIQNRLHAGSGTDFQYDAAGNMVSDPTDGVSASYDAENRITTMTKNGVAITYVYDDEGARVEKSSGGTGTLYWRMTPGVVAESDLAGNLQSEYVFFAGKRVARRDLPSGAVSYYFSDHLNSTSIVTDAQGNIKNESDFDPWGQERAFASSDSNHYKFTGQERDSESGLDYFGARYYSGSLGRFISADWSAVPVPVPYANFGDPQTLNLYSYVENSPLNKIDADGHNFAPFYSSLGAVEQENEEAYEAEFLGEEQKQAQQTQQAATHLSAADVAKIIQQAQQSSSDPATTAINIFNGLGDNVSVTGDALRQGIKDSKVTLDDTSSALLSKATSLTKTDNEVTINSSSKESSVSLGILNLKIANKVTFTVGSEKGSPELTNIAGLKAGKGVYLDVQKISVRPSGNSKAVFIQAGKGLAHKEFKVVTF